jgi:hypothetical protein
MNTLIDASILPAPDEEAILQEKDCASIADSSLSAAQVFAEQIERADNKDNGVPLFVP